MFEVSTNLKATSGIAPYIWLWPLSNETVNVTAISSGTIVWSVVLAGPLNFRKMYCRKRYLVAFL